MYEQLTKLNDRVDIIEEEVETLKLSDLSQSQRIIKLEGNYLNLENTIMKESRENREAQKEQLEIQKENTDRQWKLVEKLTGYSEDESKRNHDLKIQKYNGVTKIILGITGTGGIIYLIVQDLLTK